MRYCKNIYKVTIATKYRDFQYRLITGSLITNRKLYLWKINNDELCTFCKIQVENEIHLLCQCKHTKRIWNGIKLYIQQNDKHGVYTILSWNDFNIIFNVVHPKASNAINFVVTIVKQYLYRCRCFEQLPILDIILQEIETVYNVELSIAQYKCKISHHIAKWSSLKDFNETENDTTVEQYISNM